MKRGQIAALAAGVVVGLGGVALGVMLTRKEGRDAARRFAEQYGDLGQKGSQAAASLAQQAYRVSGQVAKTAGEQYQSQMPKAREALGGLMAQAPQAVGALGSVLPRGGQNGRAAMGEHDA